jgi:hypothetical protein
MNEIVYILINEAMPGYIKIGITKDLEARMKSLSSTSVPVPFECFFAKRVKDARAIESKMHAAFAKDRVDSGAGREFFIIPPEQAAAALSIADGEDITGKYELVATEQEKNTLAEIRSRRPVFRFSSVNIPLGSILTFSLDPSITCTVVDDRRVKYQDQIVSLSDAAMQVLHSKGLFWKAVSGPGIWMFEDEVLHERRKRMERDSDEPTDEEVEAAGDRYIEEQAEISRGK